jgi:hypothetical protein
MKHFFTLISFFFITLTSFAQGYQFGIVHNTAYNFSVVAIPDFTASNTDISDIGFSFLLPTGNYDIINITTFNGRPWTPNKITATQLTIYGTGLGDGTRDLVAMNLPPGQSILSHTAGQQIVLLTFDVSNLPVNGQLEIIANNDPISLGLSNMADCFFNSNLHLVGGSTTNDYFSVLASGMTSFSLASLGTKKVAIAEIQVKVYPNPTSEVLYIASETEPTRIDLYDILGKQVLTSTRSKELNVSHLTRGVYFVKVSFADNQITKKIVIE